MGGIQLEFATVESTATVPGRLRQAEAGVLTREIKVLWQPSDIAILPRPGIARTMMSGNEGVARDKATKEKREKVRDTIIVSNSGAESVAIVVLCEASTRWCLFDCSDDRNTIRSLQEYKNDGSMAVIRVPLKASVS